MGYTHYWKQVEPEITDRQWEAICTDARELIAASPVAIGDAWGETRCWIVNDEKIVFNGMGEDSHETFMLYRRGQDHLESWMDRASSPFGSSFTKTARKPYDAVVCGVLMSVYRHAPGWQFIDSDGYADEKIWLDALDFTRRVLGSGYAIPETIEVQGVREATHTTPVTRARETEECETSHRETPDSASEAAGLETGPGDGRVYARVLSTLSSGLREGLCISEFEERALESAMAAAGESGVTGHMAYGLASEILAAHRKYDAFPGKSLALVFCERLEELGRIGPATGSHYARIEVGSAIETPYGPGQIRYLSEDRDHAVIRLDSGGERWVGVGEIRPVAA